MTPMETAARLLRLEYADRMVLVLDSGQPSDDLFIDGVVSMTMAMCGLRMAYRPLIARDLVSLAGIETYTSIPEVERVLVCPASHDGVVVEAIYQTKDGPRCEKHVGWQHPPAVCRCDMPGAPLDIDAARTATLRNSRGEHHHPDCGMWLPPDGAVEKWIEEAGSSASVD